MPTGQSKSGAKKAWMALLILPFIFSLYAPSYNTLSPAFIGIPFFYWYQMLWIVLSGLITVAVYFLVKE